MYTEYYCPDSRLKRAAKRVSRQADYFYTEVLDHLAIEQGFRGWAELKCKGSYVSIEESSKDWLSGITDKLIVC